MKGTTQRKPKKGPAFLVLTGGPGGGKTEIIRQIRVRLPSVTVLPEAASILFSGGFPRLESDRGREALQRAIFKVQCELEQVAREQLPKNPFVLCDRGTLDGLAYWPGTPSTFWKAMGSSARREYLKYQTIIHLRVPDEDHGYNLSNPARTETPSEAAFLDRAIEKAWKGHPRRFFIEPTVHFSEKVEKTLGVLRGLIA